MGTAYHLHPNASAQLQLVLSGVGNGWMHFALLFVLAGIALEKFKVHPTYVISASLVYGALLM
ncbi:hypothetical protein JCM19241_434 [Vibrio ishigakensis]|uniref:Uncharacterized protein n=1 Tax=Vibrio ishigakensis TaxID=1481914 RepID=A0A0B8QBU3_9VIBR|nr:hypothetical protein JCM19241_434 [Vibrio ishigakensis]